MGQERIEKEQACADDDGGVGQVEVGPGVGEDVDFDEVHHGAVDDAVVEVAERAAEDEGEGDRDEGETVAQIDQGDEDGYDENAAEGGQDGLRVQHRRTTDR